MSAALLRGGAQRRRDAASAQPANISATDFRSCSRGCCPTASRSPPRTPSIQNNMSVVLLIEWKKRRLLFVGDAEWEGEFKEGKHNGSWNVMWEKHRTTHLKEPLDFLKIGHHGSINATPPPAPSSRSPRRREAAASTRSWTRSCRFPRTGKPTAQAIVSTEREFYNPIPECELLVDLARRVSNTRNYGDGSKKKKHRPEGVWVTTKAKKNKFFEKYEKNFLDQPQPLRTDLEFVFDKKDFIDVIIGPRL